MRISIPSFIRSPVRIRYGPTGGRVLGLDYSRILPRLYGELKLLEVQLVERAVGQSTDDLLSQLDQLEARVNQLNVPVTFMPMLYTLRHHMNLARERLKKLPVGKDELPPTSGETVSSW